MLLEAMLLASAMSGVAEPGGTQVTVENRTPVRTSYVAGICQTMEMQRPVGNNEMFQNRGIGIEHAAMDYVREQLGRDADLPSPSAVTVERYPVNGTLNVGYASDMDAEHGGRQYWLYTPNPSFIGTDRAQFVVDVQGTPVRVVVVVKIVEAIGTEQHKDGCKIWHWIISEPDADNSDVTNLAISQTQAQLGTLLVSASRNLAFADLSSSSVGQTTGNSITLDTDAAGHGWYLDHTPYLNEEYLPTSNPNLWIAREGSAAAGKMDLLSVLLHEYGHALGLEHSADAGNFMATTLQPGQRRLPNAEELALMAGLLGVAKETGPASPVPYDPFSPPGSPLPMTMSLAAFVATRQRHAASSAPFNGVSIACRLAQIFGKQAQHNARPSPGLYVFRQTSVIGMQAA